MNLTLLNIMLYSHLSLEALETLLETSTYSKLATETLKQDVKSVKS